MQSNLIWNTVFSIICTAAYELLFFNSCRYTSDFFFNIRSIFGEWMNIYQRLTLKCYEFIIFRYSSSFYSILHHMFYRIVHLWYLNSFKSWNISQIQNLCCFTINNLITMKFPCVSMQLCIENAAHIIMQRYFHHILVGASLCTTLGEQNVIILELAYKGINIVSWLWLL